MNDNPTKNIYKKSTLNRALRHCSGVDSETRRQILASLPLSGQNDVCDIYVILPDVPHFFWENALLGTEPETSPLRIKYNVYTALCDEDIVLLYLEEAVRMKAKALILTAAISPAIRKKLESMQRTCAVFLLSEYADLTNAFYFGSDAYREGCDMGEHFCRQFSDRIPLALDVAGHFNIGQRIRGFRDTLTKNGLNPGKQYPLSMKDAGKSNLLPSKVASLLADNLLDDTSYCLYIPFGTMQINRILQKLKGSERIICLCHDCAVKESGTLDEGIAASLNQDLFAQSSSAIRAAERYVTTGSFPDKKYTYIPSIFYSIG